MHDFTQSIISLIREGDLISVIKYSSSRLFQVGRDAKVSAQRLAALIDMAGDLETKDGLIFSFYFIFFIVLSIQNMVVPAQEQAETVIRVCSWNFLACAVYF